jgi:hypothetical protein
MKYLHAFLHSVVVVLEDLVIVALLGLALGWLCMLWWKSGEVLMRFLESFPSPV